MDSFEKNSIIVSIHISPPKVNRIFITFLKKEKKFSITSHLKDMYTIKCVLTSMRYVERVTYKHIFHLFPFQCLKGKKKTLHIKPLPSQVFKEKKSFSLREGRWGGRYK